MAITFVEKKKRQRILILALLVILFLIAGIVWWGFFVNSGPSLATQGVIASPRRIQVDTSILSHPVLKELNESKEVVRVLPKVGRENPFLPAK